MATIDMSRSHSMGLDTAKSRAEVLAQELETKLGIQWSWQGDNIRFSANSGKAKGVSGTLSVTTSKVRIELDLPFLLRAMKGVVKGKITERLDEMVA